MSGVRSSDHHDQGQTLKIDQLFSIQSRFLKKLRTNYKSVHLSKKPRKTNKENNAYG